MPRLFALLSLLFASGTHCCFIHAVELKNPFQSNKSSTKEKTFNPLLLQGALSSIIHREYSEPNVGVVVDSIGGVTLLYLPTNTRIRESILSFVKSYPNVTSVNINELKEFKPQQPKWFIPFPHTVIFSPLLANPLELEMGWAGYLYNTEVPINKENSLVTDYAIGLYIPLMRWLYTFNTKISAQFDFFAVNYGILKLLEKQQL